MLSKKTIIILALSVTLFIIFASIGKRAGWFGGEKPMLVATLKAERKTIYELIAANGKIQPETEIKISSDVSGEIVELLVKEGEAVEKGKLLLKVKPDTYISVMDRATAAVNTSKANLENTNARLLQSEAQFNKTKFAYERSKKLWDQKTISQAEWDAATAEFETAKAEVEASRQSVKSAEYNVKSAEASLKEAGENLNKTSIYAPLNGIITKLNIEKGERVVGTEMMAGTELLRIADLDRMEVKVDVNENDIVRVNTGDTAIVEVDAYFEQKFKGIVTEIGNSANIASQASADQVTSFEVKILLLKESYKQLLNNTNIYPFRPGMTANVDIQTEVRKNILSVPIEAVTSKSDSALYTNFKVKIGAHGAKEGAKEKEKASDVVFVIEKSHARVRKVVTGIQDNNFIEIREGLHENDEVIVSPYSAVSRRLKDSALVKVVDKKDLFNEK